MAAMNYLVDYPSQLSATDYDDTENVDSSIVGPRIQISNEPELRLQIREVVVDVKELRFLAYAEEDKGSLESSSHPGSCCNAAHLKAIQQNLAVATEACSLETEDYKIIEDVIMDTKVELLRLQRNPGLFPSKDTEEDFWYNIRLKCNLLVKNVILAQEARDCAHEILQGAWVEIEEGKRSPRRDMQRRPWEQFLHNRAPGAEADLSMFPKEGSVQLIPMAASRILMAILEEHRAIIRDIEAQREDLRPYAPSIARISCSDGHLRSHQVSTDLLKPTLAGPLDVVRRDDMHASLETLNLDFAALNRQRAPLRSRMWNCISLVIHDRPNHDVDSDQHADRVNEMLEMFT